MGACLAMWIFTPKMFLRRPGRMLAQCPSSPFRERNGPVQLKASNLIRGCSCQLFTQNFCQKSDFLSKILSPDQTPSVIDGTRFVTKVTVSKKVPNLENRVPKSNHCSTNLDIHVKKLRISAKCLPLKPQNFRNSESGGASEWDPRNAPGEPRR